MGDCNINLLAIETCNYTHKFPLSGKAIISSNSWQTNSCIQWPYKLGPVLMIQLIVERKGLDASPLLGAQQEVI